MFFCYRFQDLHRGLLFLVQRDRGETGFRDQEQTLSAPPFRTLLITSVRVVEALKLLLIKGSSFLCVQGGANRLVIGSAD